MNYQQAASSTGAWANLQKAVAPAGTAPAGTVYTASVPDDLSSTQKEQVTNLLVAHVQLILDAADARPPLSRSDLGSGFLVKFSPDASSIGISALHEVVATALSQAHASGSLKVFTPMGLGFSLTISPTEVHLSPFQASQQSYTGLLHGFPEATNVQLLKPAIRERYGRDVIGVKRILKHFESGSSMPTTMVLVNFRGPAPATLKDALRVVRLDDGRRLSVTYPGIKHLDTRNGKNKLPRPGSPAPQLDRASAASPKGKSRMREDGSHGDAAHISDPALDEPAPASVAPHSSSPSVYGTPLTEVPSEPEPTPSGLSPMPPLAPGLDGMPESGVAVPMDTTTSPPGTAPPHPCVVADFG